MRGIFKLVLLVKLEEIRGSLDLPHFRCMCECDEHCYELTRAGSCWRSHSCHTGRRSRSCHTCPTCCPADRMGWIIGSSRSALFVGAGAVDCGVRSNGRCSPRVYIARRSRGGHERSAKIRHACVGHGARVRWWKRIGT